MSTESDIREFLASRRAKITPAQAGLPAYGGNRRVPGLRREEVALLAGVSIDYYVRLERGHLAGASEEVLDAVAGALQLDDAERAHLHDLARAAARRPARRTKRARGPLPDSVLRVLRSMTDSPAFIRNGRLDILATNPLGRALYAPLYPDAAAATVNIARAQFLDPAGRDFFPDWEISVNTTVALLRTEAGRAPTTPTSPASSANSSPAAKSSAPRGPSTTCACTTPAASPSTTPRSGRSPSTSTPWSYPPSPDSP